MNKIQTRIVSILVAITITIGLLPGLKVNASVVASGDCGANGDNVSWTLDDAETLTISGAGAIAESAFCNNAQVKAQVKTVVIEEGITGIGGNAFKGCTSLESVTVPVSVESIGDNAFADCTALTSFEADATLLQIIDVEKVFANSDKVSFVACTYKITYNTCSFGAVSGPGGAAATDEISLNVSPELGYVVDTVTFTDNKGTTTTITPDSDGKYSFTMPSGEVTVGATFKQLGANANIVDSGTCGEGVSWTLDTEGTLTISGSGTIDARAFRNNENIKTVVIEEGITGIGESAFFGSNLISVEIPSTVTSIGKGAFQYCYELTTANIPGSVKCIQERTFAHCSALTSVVIGYGVESIDEYAFRECAFKEISLPDTVNTIENYAFYYCKNLTSITIPSKVGWIGRNAFNYCSSLTFVRIPSIVAYIGQNAFANCGSLSEVYIDEEDYEDCGASAFPGVPATAFNFYYEIKVNGGSSDTVDAYEGCLITITAEVPEGNSFFKWETDSTSVVFDNANNATTTFTMPAESVEITAKYSKCVVTFDTCGYGTAPSAQTIDNGEKVTKPEDPSCDGLVFKGWTVYSFSSDSYDFDTPVTSDLKLYAIWVDLCKVSFDVNGHGDAPSDQEIAYGDTLTKPTDPSAPGYRFDGWYYDPEFTYEFDFNDPVYGSGSIYAKWTPIYTVTFNVNGQGTVPSAQEVISGDKATKPADPTATGYTFGGWYTDSACTTTFDFNSAITADITLYAKWTANSFTVTYSENGHGVAPAAQTVTYGNIVTKPSDPTATGYTFGGWYKDSACTTEYDFNTAVTSNITLYAKWTAVTTTPAPATPAPTPDPTPVADEEVPAIVSGIAHVQDVGNVTTYMDPETSFLYLGTEGQGKRLESITLNFENPTSYSGTLEYRVHVQDIGWTDWVTAGNPAGTVGQSKRIEAIEIRLTGELADNYSVFYGVHIQDYGDMQGWVQDGALAGTTGESKRIEALAVVIVPKGMEDNISVQYRVHVQDYGWESSYASDGKMAGTSGQSKRLEGIEMFLTGCPYSGGIQYKTHIQDIGWESSWTKNGEMSGTQGQSKRLEGICIELYGEVAEYYDIYYRVHAQDIGWMAWAKNGECAGTAGRSARLEGIQIVLVPKGDPAPGATYEGITSVTEKAFIEGF